MSGISIHVMQIPGDFKNITKHDKPYCVQRKPILSASYRPGPEPWTILIQFVDLVHTKKISDRA